MVTLFFTDTESFFVVLVLIFVKTTVSVTRDVDEDDDNTNRLSWELFVQEAKDDEEGGGFSFFLEVKQEPPHSCTLTTRLDLVEAEAKLAARLSLPGLEPECLSLLITRELSVNPL